MLAWWFAVTAVGLADPVHREVVLRGDAQVHQENVYGQPYVATALILPEAATEVVCGDCTEKPGEQPENWRIEKTETKTAVYLRPTRLPDQLHPFNAFRTTIHITLESGYRLSINLGLASPRDGPPPDAEVSFRLPEKALLAGRLAEEKKKLEEHFRAELDRSVDDRFLTQLMGEIACEDYVGAPNRKDGIVVRLKQSCVAVGGSVTQWVVFEVQNRGNAKLVLGSAMLRPAAGDADVWESARYRFARDALRFDERGLGIALARLGEGERAGGEWELVVTEEGGEERSVSIGGLSF